MIPSMRVRCACQSTQPLSFSLRPAPPPLPLSKVPTQAHPCAKDASTHAVTAPARVSPALSPSIDVCIPSLAKPQCPSFVFLLIFFPSAPTLCMQPERSAAYRKCP